MANLRRLICKRFGGTSNFISYALLTLIVYLLVKNHYSDKSHIQKISPERPATTSQSHIINLQEQPAVNPKAAKETKAPIIFEEECKIQESCTDQQVPYKILSGDGKDKYPVICLNGKVLMGKNLKDSKIGRGINMVVLDKETLAIKSADSYDTFTDDGVFYRFVKMEIADGDIVLIASFDEMANALRESTALFMNNFGSQLFTNVKFRDSFVMIGQKGITKGKAIEIHEPKKGGKDYAPPASISGCTTFPMGIIHPVKLIEMQVNSIDNIVIKDVVTNCGMREECKSDEFPVHVYTGVDANDEPKICVDGRYVISKGINDAGRGINIVVVGNGKEIIKTAHFDTYAEDSTNLEIFLESLYENTIIIAVTFDEASAKLATLARNLFFDLGSGLIQNLRFRDAWFFVGRKGIQGFSPIEEISYAGSENAFPKVIDKKFCVSQALAGQRIRPDPLPNMNDGRRDFCSRYDGYGDFCTNENIDKPLRPAPIINKTLEEHPVYNMPIIIIAGMSHNSLRMTLETVIMQPGIRPELVHVCIDEKLVEQSGLVELFGFQYVKIKSSYNYTEIYHKSLKAVLSTGDSSKDKDSVIVIEEELILSPDFLYFFSQVYDSYINDPNVAAVSSWNSNSFLQLDGSSSYVYRTNEFPGLGFMLKKKIYETYMKGKLASCCSERVWNEWRLKDESGNVKKMEVIIPDVSRIFRRPYDLSKSDFSFLKSLFNRKRKTNLTPFPELRELETLGSTEKYKAFLSSTLKTAETFNAASCYSEGKVTLPTTKNQYFKVVFEQNDKNDLKNLKSLSKCFHLFNFEGHDPKGLYSDSVLRFHAHHNNFILIGSKNKILL